MSRGLEGRLVSLEQARAARAERDAANPGSPTAEFFRWIIAGSPPPSPGESTGEEREAAALWHYLNGGGGDEAA